MSEGFPLSKWMGFYDALQPTWQNNDHPKFFAETGRVAVEIIWHQDSDDLTLRASKGVPAPRLWQQNGRFCLISPEPLTQHAG